MLQFNIETLDGLKLHGQSWIPEDQTRAVVCLVHGLGGHSGRYAHVAQVFTQAGFALMALDLRGHGRSEGKRGHAPSYTVLMDDLYQLLEKAKEQYPETPVFLYGHSLGGNLVIHYALKRMVKLNGIIATSPLFRTTAPPPVHKIYLLRMMYRLWPSLTISSGLEESAFSRDALIMEAYDNDPLVHDRVSVRLGLDMLRAGMWNMRHAADLSCPMLVMHGKADRITSAKASLEFSLRAGDLCSMKLWNDCYHELHNEPDRQNVFDFMLGWIADQISPV